MKKVLNYILLLTIMFIVPKTVLAESFRYVEVDSSIHLTYTIDGEVKNYTANLCESVSYGYSNYYTATEDANHLKLYQVDDNDNKTELTNLSVSCENNDHGNTNYSNTLKYRYTSQRNSQFDNNNKYMLEYTITTENGSTITYEKEFNYTEYTEGATESFENTVWERVGRDWIQETYYGTVVKINDTIQGDYISPKLNIRKNLEKIEKDGTFTFNIKDYDNENDEGTNVSVTTNNLTGILENIKLAPNKKYKITEVLDTNSEYKLVSFKNGEETITTNELVIETGDWNSGNIEIIATNGPRVEHNKTIDDNHDGTYTLSLDVKGENVTGNANKANVIIIYDTSGSMNYYLPSDTGRWGTTDEGVIPRQTGQNRLELFDSDHNSLDATNNDSYTGDVFERVQIGGWGRYEEPIYRYDKYNGQRYSNEVRLATANEATLGMVDELLSYNDKEGNEPDTVEVALVTFATEGTKRDFDDTPGVTNYWTTDYDTFEDHLPTSATGGTNWESALITAKEIADAKRTSGDKDPTYIIFVTDGNPTYYINDITGRIAGDGYDIEPEYTANVNNCLEEAKPHARALITSPNGYILYTIGIYGSVDRMETLTDYAYGGEGKGDGYYFPAENTAALNAAFDTILSAIERAGIGSVSIFDGTTHSVSVSTEDTVDLLTIDEESGYEYWLTFPIQSDGTIKFNEEVVTLTKVDDTHYTLSYGDGKTIPNIVGYIDTETNTFHYKWESANELYDVAPPAAYLDKNEYLDETDEQGKPIKNPEFGAVKWDLQSAGILLNDVTYSVKFKVWPSQYTYDLIASLKNGANYNDLPVNVRRYLKEINGSYVLYTNTTATVSFTDSRGNTGTITSEYKNPKPVATGVSSIKVKKEWINNLDDRKEGSVKLYATRDGSKYGDPITLSDSNSWQGDISISVGSISVQYTKIEGEEGEEDDIYIPVHARVLELGYDYSFAEDDYRWHLEVDTMRPMMINGQLTMLVKTDEKTVDDVGAANILVEGNNTYYVINNKVYKVVTDTSNTFIVTNSRKSNIELKKIVNGTVPEDTFFEFHITVDSPNKEADKLIYFSVRDDSDLTIPENQRPFITNLDTSAQRQIATLKTSDIHITNIRVSDDKKTITYVYKNNPDDEGTEYTVDYAKAPETINGVLTYYYYTDYYYFNNKTYNEDGTVLDSGTIYVKLKPNWNLRFTNLPIGTKYSFKEVADEDEYEVESSGVTAYYYTDYTNKVTAREDIPATDDAGNQIITISSDKSQVDGSIYKDNRNFLVQFINKMFNNIISGVKRWIDGNNENGTRPGSITVNLSGKVGDEEVYTDTTSVTPDKDGNWTYSFTAPRYSDEEHKVEIKYSVIETPIQNYETTYDGFNIINRLLTSVSGTKTWIDNNNYDHQRPSSITVVLTGKVGNEVVGDPIRLSVASILPTTDTNWNTDTVWNYVFDDLPMYDDNNNKIVYTVSEDLGELAKLYKSSQSGNNFTNIYIDTHKDFDITKVWNLKGTRIPEKVLLELYYLKNNTEVIGGSKELTIRDKKDVDTTWTSTIVLPMYYLDNGNLVEITYFIRELSINGKSLTNNSLDVTDSNIWNIILGKWDASVNNDTLTVTNTWTPANTAEFQFTKVRFHDENYHPLAGAIFRLYRYIGRNADGTADNSKLDSIIDVNNVDTNYWVEITTLGGDEVSYFDFNSLYEGEYRLVEIKAPNRYILPAGQWHLHVTPDEAKQVTISSVGIVPALIDEQNGKYYIPNQEIPDIPTTGGIGIPNYQQSGLLLMIISICILIINQIKQNKKQENF